MLPAPRPRRFRSQEASFITSKRDSTHQVDFLKRTNMKIDIKRAHEKTAQAIVRDGEAPLRKRLSDEITSDLPFLLDAFNKKIAVNRPSKKSRKSASAMHLLLPTKENKVQLQDKKVSPPPISSSTTLTLDQWQSSKLCIIGRRI